MSEQETHIQSMQRRFFGERFVGASLSRVNVGDGLSEKIGSYIKSPAKFLVIVGPPGTGKTYICSALMEIMPKRVTSIRAYSERKLLEKLRMGISQGVEGDYMSHLHYLIDDDFVIIDDLGSSGHNAWREEILMEAIDYRYKDGKKTVFTSNLSSKDFMDVYGERIKSRLFATENTVVSLFGQPDLRAQGF